MNAPSSTREAATRSIRGWSGLAESILAKVGATGDCGLAHEPINTAVLSTQTDVNPRMNVSCTSSPIYALHNKPGQTQYATPRCVAQLPARVFFVDHVRFLHRAVAPFGTV